MSTKTLLSSGVVRCSSRQRVLGQEVVVPGKSGLGPTRPNAGLPSPLVDRLPLHPSPSASTSTFWVFPISISALATSSKQSHHSSYNVSILPPRRASGHLFFHRTASISLACKSASECTPSRIPTNPGSAATPGKPWIAATVTTMTLCTTTRPVLLPLASPSRRAPSGSLNSLAESLESPFGQRRDRRLPPAWYLHHPLPWKNSSGADTKLQVLFKRKPVHFVPHYRRSTTKIKKCVPRPSQG